MNDKQVNIALGVNASGLISGFNEAAQKLSSFSSKATSELDILSVAYRNTTRDAGKLLSKFGETSEAFKDASNKANDLRSKIEGLGGVVGTAAAPINNAYQSAGKLAGGYNMLGVSINQLSRELPNFAMNVNTGFMAISNNIPMFADALQNLKVQNAALVASGQAAIPIWTSLSAAIFSWQTALSLGIVVLTAFGPKLVEMIIGVNESTDAVREATKALDDYNYQVNEYLASDFQKKIMGEVKAYEKLIAPMKLEAQLLENKKKLIESSGGLMEQGEIDKMNQLHKTLSKMEIAFQANIQKIKDDQNKDKGKKVKAKEFIPIAWGNGGYLESITSKSGLAVSNLTDKLLNLKKIGQEAFVNTAHYGGRFAERMTEVMDSVSDQLMTLAVQGFGQFGEMIGASLAGANQDFGAAASMMLASIASTIGQGMIAIGLPMLAAVATAGEGLALIGGGTALMAVSGALKANANPPMSSGGSYGGSSGNYGNYTPAYNTMSTVVVLDGRVRGSDIIISAYNQSLKNKRTK